MNNKIIFGLLVLVIIVSLLFNSHKNTKSFSKDYSDSNKSVKYLKGTNIKPDEKKLSKTVENNSKASGLNGLSLD